MEACSYIVAPAIIEGVKRYGIAILKQINGEWIQTYEINDICTDESEISRLVERCNNLY